MHQVSIICECEVRCSGSTLRTLELEIIGPDEAVVIQAIEEGVVIGIVDALRKAAANSILADGVFNDGTVWFADGGHGEGAGCDLAGDGCCRDTEA
jgi:hypothetical protein